MKRSKLTPFLILIGVTTVGCTPLSETRLDPVLVDVPRDLLGSVRSEPCDYFFGKCLKKSTTVVTGQQPTLVLNGFSVKEWKGSARFTAQLILRAGQARDSLVAI